MQWVLHILKREREADMHHHRRPDDLGDGAKTAEGLPWSSQEVSWPPAPLKPSPCDTAAASYATV